MPQLCNYNREKVCVCDVHKAYKAATTRRLCMVVMLHVMCARPTNAHQCNECRHKIKSKWEAYDDFRALLEPQTRQMVGNPGRPDRA